MKLVNVEYRLREVTRYIVTRYAKQETEEGHTGCGDSRVIGEYDNADTAYAVGYAMCRNEHQNLGWLPGDERIQYPRHPDDATAGQMAQAEFVPAAKIRAATEG